MSGVIVLLPSVPSPIVKFTEPCCLFSFNGFSYVWLNALRPTGTEAIMILSLHYLGWGGDMDSILNSDFVLLISRGFEREKSMLSIVLYSFLKPEMKMKSCIQSIKAYIIGRSLIIININPGSCVKVILLKQDFLYRLGIF